MKRVLISNISGYKAIVIASFLRNSYKDIYIVGTDTREFSKLFHTNSIDHYDYISPEANYVDSISEIIREKNINIFIPTHSSEMDIVLRDRSSLGKTLDYFGSYDSFKLLNDKLSLIKICAEIGIKTPRLYKSINYEQFPYVVKPRHSAASKGVMYVFDQDSYRDAKSAYQNNNIIIQEYIKGIGVGYSLFANKGKIIVGYGHKRLAEYPVSGGSSVYRDEYIDKRMVEIASKIISYVVWSGFAMFEFKLTSKNELFLIEVNPRIWGSINQGLSNGVNYFSQLIGISTNQLQVNKAYKTYLSPLVYVSLLNYGLRFRFKNIKIFISNILSNKSDISVIKDPKGWFGVLFRSFT